MVMARKKIEQKREVVMIVETNKNGGEVGRRGNIWELIRLGVVELWLQSI
jgi:hypothetical protein